MHVPADEHISSLLYKNSKSEGAEGAKKLACQFAKRESSPAK